MADKKIVFRSSVSGKFVTERFANTHKPTTERQHVPVKNPKK